MTPFAAATTWTRDERGAEFWLVAIKACFEIDPDGRQSPAAQQTKVHRAPAFSGDPMTSSLVNDSDFVLSKEGTDVLVAGHAYAPEGRPTMSCSVRLEVQSVDKALDVIGDRRLFRGLSGLSVTDPEPFLDMPLTWERTYGGWDRRGSEEAWEPSNPVGRGFATDPSHLEESPAPNIEYPSDPYRGPSKGRAAALGPVASHWHPRQRYAGTYGRLWSETRDPLLPTDFDRRYFRCAPEDQQTPKPLVGYEEVRLRGLTPDGELRFVLPRLSFDIVTTFRRYGDVRQRPSIHTLWLMPDRRRFEIVYASALEVPPGREEKLIATNVSMRKRVHAPSSVRYAGVWSAD